jgi:bifunctional DNA-binding transcriptional regulator/antitoxin component of YhaV-PrlF toxin-antitoxin module
MAKTWVSVAPNGRLSLPIDVRRRLGIERGGNLLLDADDEPGVVVLRTTTAVVKRAQRLARELLVDRMPSVDELLAERREEARREERKMRRILGEDETGSADEVA